ncbi:hypothetical protein HHL19_09730 [Streptomyces sp. R302]|uniref:hypothetical protein n=1 Tax=unclassified Streptomyces TaxID=2593676 RepID=UPI00145DD0D5|nr:MULTISPECIES: hypothetical protein [unclassified Streptomyces]NML49950.1 hypothetical protein [Streptomyces sp. R301]NML78941.1 hypothetical protein [Streptomyces sp. R302]
MAIIDELRTPLYFAAGTADLAVRQARKVPALIEQLAAEAPGRIEAVRKTDPKAVQEKVQEKVQATVAEVVGAVGRLDTDLKKTDLKKLGETAQDLALRGVGVAAEYAVKAREKYEEVAAQGEETVRAWRGETAEPVTEITVVVEPEAEAETPVAEAPVAEPEPVAEPAPKPAAARKAAARKTPAKKAAADKADVADVAAE